MARGKSHIKQSEVARAARGLMAAASATGLTGDIEVDLARGVVKFHMIEKSRAGATHIADTEEWN